MTIRFHELIWKPRISRGRAYQIIIHRVLNDRRVEAGIDMTPKNSSRNVEAASNFALSNTVNKLGKIVR